MSQLFPFHDADLSQLPPPKLLKDIDYETLLEQRKATLNGLHPILFNEDGQPVLKPATLIQTDTESFWKIPLDDNAGLYHLELESEPMVRLLQVDTYYELLFRQDLNETGVSGMPAYATGSDLDNIGSRLEYKVHRLIITPGTETSAAVYEADEPYRRRILLALEGKARGRSKGWYLFHTLSADGNIKDAKILSPSPLHIDIILLQYADNGNASNDLIDIVKQHITSSYKPEQGDILHVKSTEIIEYTIDATIEFYHGPSPELILKTIKTSWMEFIQQSEKIGHDITESGVLAALHQAGVYKVTINHPFLPITINDEQAPFCAKITVNNDEL